MILIKICKFNNFIQVKIILFIYFLGPQYFDVTDLFFWHKIICIFLTIFGLLLCFFIPTYLEVYYKNKNCYNRQVLLLFSYYKVIIILLVKEEYKL